MNREDCRVGMRVESTSMWLYQNWPKPVIGRVVDMCPISGYALVQWDSYCHDLLYAHYDEIQPHV